MRKRLRKHRLFVLLLIAALAATSTFAFTNAVGGVTPLRLGSGSNAIGKYTLGTPLYTLNADSPRNLDSVSFTLTGATTATVVRVRVIAAGNWYTCSSAAAPTISCATTAPQITAVGANGNTLLVVATG